MMFCDVMFCDVLCAEVTCYSYCCWMLGQHMQPIKVLNDIIRYVIRCDIMWYDII